MNQVGIATTVTTPVLVAVLATIAGVLIVGVGGGLIKPMQHRWEGYLARAEAEAPKIKQQADQAPTVSRQARSYQQVYDQTQVENGQQYGATAAHGDDHPRP